MPRVSGKPQPSARPGSRHALRRSGQPIFMPSVNSTTNSAISAIVETSSEVESKLRMPEVSEPITKPTTKNNTAAEGDALLRHWQEQVQAESFHARHRGDRLTLLCAVDHEDRIDQVVGCHKMFADQVAGKTVMAQAPWST